MSFLTYDEWVHRRVAHGQAVEKLYYGIYLGVSGAKQDLQLSDAFTDEQKMIIGKRLTDLLNGFDRTVQHQNSSPIEET